MATYQVAALQVVSGTCVVLACPIHTPRAWNVGRAQCWHFTFLVADIGRAMLYIAPSDDLCAMRHMSDISCAAGDLVSYHNQYGHESDRLGDIQWCCLISRQDPCDDIVLSRFAEAVVKGVDRSSFRGQSVFHHTDLQFSHTGEASQSGGLPERRVARRSEPISVT